METQFTGDGPSPEEARAALAAADAEESATVNRPVPVWYSPVLASLIFLLFCLNAVDERATTLRISVAVLAVILAAAVGWLVWRVSFTQPGYRGIRVSWGWTVLVALIGLVFPIAALLVEGPLGSWVWIPAGAGLSALILVVGVRYQREYRDA